jgi:hypothetical protein
VARKYYTIDYWLDEKESELHITIYQGKKVVFAKDTLGDFESEEDKCPLKISLSLSEDKFVV